MLWAISQILPAGPVRVGGQPLRSSGPYGKFRTTAVQRLLASKKLVEARRGGHKPLCDFTVAAGLRAHPARRRKRVDLTNENFLRKEVNGTATLVLWLVFTEAADAGKRFYIRYR